MPLELRVQIEPARKVLTLWEGKNFVKEYPFVSMDLGSLKGALQTEIGSKTGIIGDRRYTPGQKEYRASEKVFMLKKTTLQIRAVDYSKGGETEDLSPGPGFHLSVEDAEELALLLRPGNEVEIRPATP